MFCLLMISSGNVYAQACGASSAPVVNNMLTYSLVNDGFNIQLLHDKLYLNNIISGTKNLDDNSRERITQTATLKLTYTIKGKCGILAVLPYVWRTEDNQLNNNSFISSTNGIGDISILGFYLTELRDFEYL